MLRLRKPATESHGETVRSRRASGIVCAQFRVTANGELFARARAGESRAFAAIVAEHGPDVLRIAMVITADRLLAEDAAQNTWQKVWRRLDTVRDFQSLRPWLLRVAANEAKQLVRRNRRHPTDALDAANSVVGAHDPYDDVDLRIALKPLSPDERELLARRYALGFNAEEIGEQLGISAEGVRSRLKRLRDRARKELERNG